MLKALKEEREKLAKELKVQPSLLATNYVLEEFSSGVPAGKQEMARADLLMPWQVEVVGESFLKILHPKVSG